MDFIVFSTGIEQLWKFAQACQISLNIKNYFVHESDFFQYGSFYNSAEQFFYNFFFFARRSLVGGRLTRSQGKV
jgi:hypothetical protein